MNKTNIEWCDYSVNPVKGLCPMACPYCYARRLYKRFKWDLEIEYWPEAVMETSFLKKPSRIFVGSTMELFGPWVKDWMMKEILDLCAERATFGHTFIFLTKQPQNLIKWSPFPENCWVGVSATNAEMFITAGYALEEIQAKVKFISAEPLLEWPCPSHQSGFIGTMLNRWGINWVIIGQQTPVKLATMPKIGWVEEIVSAADKVKIPVFLKDNLKPLIKLERQEFPIIKEDS